VIGVGYGAFAEFMVLPAAAAMPVPTGWTAEQALGLVVNWPTALAALKPQGHIAAGETVLVHAAAGATGQAAAIVYHRDRDGELRSHGIVVLALTATGLSRVVEFHDPALVLVFGFPDVLADRARAGVAD
jgi:hypothetical protein